MLIRASVFVACVLHTSVMADVTVYDDTMAWESATGGDFSTMDFTGYPENTIITDQYADLGVVFTQGGVIFETAGFLEDGWGMLSNLDEFILEFDQPMHWIAADHPGILEFRLYLNGQLVGETGVMGGSGAGFFSGVTSDVPFDCVVMLDPLGVPAVDDIHFGPAIPAPATWTALVLSIGAGRRRRRL